VLRRIFGFKGDEIKRSGENYMMRSLMVCIANPIILGC
jgi:hypothetical protein